MILWLMLAACSSPDAASVATDADPPARVVSLAPAITQVVLATAPDRLVGYDSYSAELELPETAQGVGNPRALSAEGVLSLDPTVVLLDDTAGPPEVLTQLTDAGLRMVKVPHPATLDGVRAMITSTGEALGVDVTSVQADFDASCAELPETIDAAPRALFVYARGVGAMSVSGTDTAAAAMLELAGVRNAVTEYEGYKPLTPEAAVVADPDWVVMTTRGLQAVGGVEGLAGIPGLAELDAVQAGRVAAVDDFQLLAYGLDACDGARALAERVGEH